MTFQEALEVAREAESFSFGSGNKHPALLAMAEQIEANRKAIEDLQLRLGSHLFHEHSIESSYKLPILPEVESSQPPGG